MTESHTYKFGIGIIPKANFFYERQFLCVFAPLLEYYIGNSPVFIEYIISKTCVSPIHHRNTFGALPTVPHHRKAMHSLMLDSIAEPEYPAHTLIHKTL